MYRVERKDNNVIISGPNGSQVFSTTQYSYVVFKEGNDFSCKLVKDLTDANLVLALATAVRIITDEGRY